MTRLYGAEGLDLDCVTDLLLSGQLVALPTETVYGLAGDALREDVVRQIFEVKMRVRVAPLRCKASLCFQGEAGQLIRIGLIWLLWFLGVVDPLDLGLH